MKSSFIGGIFMFDLIKKKKLNMYNDFEIKSKNPENANRYINKNVRAAL